MLTKLIQILADKRTIKILASLIMILVLVIALTQWLSQAPNTIQNISSELVTHPVSTAEISVEGKAETKGLRAWTINLVEQFNWQDSAGLTVLNTFLLFGFLSLATSVGLPRQIAALVAGINLGALGGVIIATLAATLGCLITFSVSRYLLSDKVAKKYPSKLEKLSDFLGEQTFLKAVVIRIFPLGSNFLTNIIAGVTKISMPVYVSGSFVGFIPQMLIFSLAGSGLHLGEKNELIASAVLFIIAFALSAYMFKKHKEKSVVAKRLQHQQESNNQ
ncbi:VTT domain-containing protein [Colwellia sp. E2M01]|uniref:TVP38/TMEM64 family protein n=1 Tax=Colwellia sp. E2M01 TaxID=2841561 RepID=UPI001C0898C2|nr:VTT domain-containing protein [Colwellia sp. E2M01]MBU2872149.1 VTT domain-containing protein [Colwellia sp. E2M01]